MNIVIQATESGGRWELLGIWRDGGEGGRKKGSKWGR